MFRCSANVSFAKISSASRQTSFERRMIYLRRRITEREAIVKNDAHGNDIKELKIVTS